MAASALLESMPCGTSENALLAAFTSLTCVAAFLKRAAAIHSAERRIEQLNARVGALVREKQQYHKRISSGVPIEPVITFARRCCSGPSSSRS